MSKKNGRAQPAPKENSQHEKGTAAHRGEGSECAVDRRRQAGVGRRVRHQPTLSDPPLLRVLLHAADRRGHTVTAMAAELGVSQGYIFQLRSGQRKTEHVGQEFTLACARYLRIPVVLVKVWAGRIRLTDFGWPASAANTQRDRDLADLGEDPAYAGLVPEELAQCSDAMKDLIWNLYCEATGRQPVTWVTLPRMLDYLQRAALAMEEHESGLRDPGVLFGRAASAEENGHAAAAH